MLCSSINILCVLLFLPYATLTSPPTFTDPSTSSFNNLVIDSTDRVYIGAVNKIYKLSPELEVEQSAVTGPDNNVNKILLVDHATNRLITCGSAHGSCSARSLSNISEVRDVQEQVVPSSAEASTVAFIADGPAKKQVMYVGASYTPNQDGIVLPAVSSRSLDEDHLFNMEHTGTKIFVNSLSREQYPINYVYGFSSEGFSYFLTTQIKEGSDTFHTKLVRICHDDENYYSYTEIPLTCKAEGADYNLVQAAFVGKGGQILARHLGINSQQDVLFAAFSSSEAKNTNKPSDSSALCIYSLKDIRRKFTQNIQTCFSGHGARGLDFISPTHPCISTKLVINEDFCGLDVNTPLGGQDALEAAPVAIMSERVTAVTVSVINDYTIVISGTAHGHLKKILVEGTTASEYNDITIDQDSPIKKLVFKKHDKHLYVMTSRKVSKVKVQECSAHKSCSTCLEAKDAYCGWCTSENKCSTQSHCMNGLSEPMTWRQRIPPHRTDTCVAITRVEPHQLQRTKSATLSLYIDNLPTDDTKFYCVFSVFSDTIRTVATRKPYGVDCDSPPVSSLPKIPSGHHRLKAKLYVRTTQEIDLASTDFIFYDCSTYTSCTECASTSYICDWCMEGDRCTHDGPKYCHNDILVTHNSSVNEGPNSCLSFYSKSDSNEILIHSGVAKAISVRAHITGLFVVQTRLLCEFIIEGQKFRVNAQLLGDTIYCDKFEFTYTSTDPFIWASFNILWAGGSKMLDNPDNVHIIIYRCSKAEDCGTCLMMAEKYQCGWCRSTDKCKIQDHCHYPNEWFGQNRACPDPKIHSFTPHSGPWEGGTNITITGINLGRTVSDIKEVVAAGTNCEPIPELYVKTKQIVCRTEGPGDDNLLREGVVFVRIAEYAGASNTPYSFVDPEIHSIDPKYGPQAGGSLLRIKGEHLNAGSNIKVYIGDLPCDIVETERRVIVCKTKPSHEPKNCTLRVHFDNAVRVLNNETFEYLEDPVIISADSGISLSKKQPKGTPKGGTNIIVTGRNFRGIQFPHIRVYYNNRSFTAICHHYINLDTQLKCKAPKVIIDVPIDPERPLELEYGFDMASVESVRKVSSKLGSYLLYPNPVYDKFDGIKNLTSDYLTLNGNNLDWACTSDEITVRIGDKICMLTSISRHQLTCKPPPLSDLAAGVDAYDVVVKVGRRQRYEIGKIAYVQNL